MMLNSIWRVDTFFYMTRLQYVSLGGPSKINH